MASPSSSLTTRNWSYNVFASFHGPDVRKTLLSHMREQFKNNGITMFNDQKMVRGDEIAPSLTDGIRESRISIVILSKKYASSSWCLDELVEILECKKTIGQIVMTIFYGVEPSDVRKHTGEFGIAFNETCKDKTEDEKHKWRKALTDVSNIAGEDFLKCENEVEMVKKIARDVSDKLFATPSRDFDGMVGLEAHLRELNCLLDIDKDDVRMVAITGPVGIGKTTIARALQSQISNRFQLTCFVDNLKGNYHSSNDKLHLQEQFLSELLNLDSIRICHSGVIEERLCKQRVLIILDDVNHIKQLEALANENTWFGAGSRIVITTENKELLQQHGIKITYRVGLPSDEEALKILCRYAFRKNSHNHGFDKLLVRVTKLCGNLPLGLSVVGSSLRGKEEPEWEDVVSSLETTLDRDSQAILDRDIEDILRVGYESLDENEQTLFLLIAVFFNYKDLDLVKTMLADSDLYVKRGLKILVNRSLIMSLAYGGRIVMHRVLQQMGNKAIHKQEPAKRRILTNAREICDVLRRAKGTWNVIGISFDISRISELFISKKAFERMPDLLFLRVYKRRYDGNDRMHIPEEIEFPCGLRLLEWEAYPSKSLPPTFNPQYLVELSMKNSKMEKLWEGIKPLTNLKKVDLSGSIHLKELPNLSNATNLVKLDLIGCESLIELPSSCSNLHKLQKLWMTRCIKLQVIPPHMNLASLEVVFMKGCSRLRNIPVMSTNIRQLCISETAVEDVPASNSMWSRLTSLSINKTRKLKGLTHLPKNVTELDLSYSDIERISDSIKALHHLRTLNLSGCKRLSSLPKLPRSLKSLMAEDCEALENVFSPLNTPSARLIFINCFKLDHQARGAIFQHSFFLGVALLPGSEVPAEFDHRGRVNSLTIRPDGNPYSGFVVCVVISSKHQVFGYSQLMCRRVGVAEDDFYPVEMLVYVGEVHKFRTEHLFVFDSRFLEFYPSDMNREIVLELSSNSNDFNVIDCGARIFTEENGSYESGSDQVLEDDIELEPSEVCEDDTEPGAPTNGVICYSKEDENLDGGKRTDCWSWLFLCFDLSHFVRFGFEKKTIESGSGDMAVFQFK